MKQFLKELGDLEAKCLDIEKNKKSVGRPRKYENGEEPKSSSVRFTKEQRIKIMEKYGSIAAFIKAADKALLSSE